MYFKFVVLRKNLIITNNNDATNAIIESPNKYIVITDNLIPNKEKLLSNIKFLLNPISIYKAPKHIKYIIGIAKRK
jgi:hypothetical protein